MKRLETERKEKRFALFLLIISMSLLWVCDAGWRWGLGWGEGSVVTRIELQLDIELKVDVKVSARTWVLFACIDSLIPFLCSPRSGVKTPV